MGETTTIVASEPVEVPAWVERMRAAGYTVHHATREPTAEPEFAFTALPEPSGARRLWRTLRMLASGEYRLGLVRRNGPFR